jgi:CRISPR/Cas system-associated endoribonuclease Cas2
MIIFYLYDINKHTTSNINRLKKSDMCKEKYCLTMQYYKNKVTRELVDGTASG